MQVLDNREIESTEIKPILSVEDFCRRYRWMKVKNHACAHYSATLRPVTNC